MTRDSRFGMGEFVLLCLTAAGLLFVIAECFIDDLRRQP